MLLELILNKLATLFSLATKWSCQDNEIQLLCKINKCIVQNVNFHLPHRTRHLGFERTISNWFSRSIFAETYFLVKICDFILIVGTQWIKGLLSWYICLYQFVVFECCEGVINTCTLKWKYNNMSKGAKQNILFLTFQ